MMPTGGGKVERCVYLGFRVQGLKREGLGSWVWGLERGRNNLKERRERKELEDAVRRSGTPGRLEPRMHTNGHQ
jgi:hypothetical protein